MNTSATEMDIKLVKKSKCLFTTKQDSTKIPRNKLKRLFLVEKS